ncbi:hypothetical protein K0M31_010503 [Melipona bicolor]|uniref:Uncharacterized protein n=1 Tax=Melipona bicolor TaxID=60889 RepID=A0AA40FLZ5_9HYME|nr:hypothetical protein K0M31_010503 [Melipona bicolor]
MRSSAGQKEAGIQGLSRICESNRSEKRREPSCSVVRATRAEKILLSSSEGRPVEKGSKLIGKLATLLVPRTLPVTEERRQVPDPSDDHRLDGLGSSESVRREARERKTDKRKRVRRKGVYNGGSPTGIKIASHVPGDSVDLIWFPHRAQHLGSSLAHSAPNSHSEFRS